MLASTVHEAGKLQYSISLFVFDNFFKNIFFSYIVLTVLFPGSPRTQRQFIILIPVRNKIRCVSTALAGSQTYLFLFSHFFLDDSQQNGMTITACSFYCCRCIIDSTLPIPFTVSWQSYWIILIPTGVVPFPHIALLLHSLMISLAVFCFCLSFPVRCRLGWPFLPT